MSKFSMEKSTITFTMYTHNANNQNDSFNFHLELGISYELTWFRRVTCINGEMKFCFICSLWQTQKKYVPHICGIKRNLKNICFLCKLFACSRSIWWTTFFEKLLIQLNNSEANFSTIYSIGTWKLAIDLLVSYVRNTMRNRFSNC